MVYVAELARLAGGLDDATAARHRTALGRVGLPTRWYGASLEELRAAMTVDKKARGAGCGSSCSTASPEPRGAGRPAGGHAAGGVHVMTRRVPR